MWPYMDNKHKSRVIQYVRYSNGEEIQQWDVSYMLSELGVRIPKEVA